MPDNNFLITPQQLQIYSRRLELIKLTAAQIQRDFDMAGYEITFSENDAGAYEELFVQIFTVIKKLIDTNYESLLQLLYRIDVSENKIKNEAAISEEPFAEIITRLIIYRELQKVVTRLYFKEKG